MPPYELLFKPSAKRELRKLPRDVQERFARALEDLAVDPAKPRPSLDVKPLKGMKGLWRLRVGDYRAVYEIADGVVRFIRFGHRSNFYSV